jgi:hypothetical protein
MGYNIGRMEPIIDYIKRNLRAAGAARWPAIAAVVSTNDAPISEHLLRKLAYGDRDNPRLDKVQPLLDFFHAVDRGEVELPEPQATAPGAQEAA